MYLTTYINNFYTVFAGEVQEPTPGSQSVHEIFGTLAPTVLLINTQWLQHVSYVDMTNNFTTQHAYRDPIHWALWTLWLVHHREDYSMLSQFEYNAPQDITLAYAKQMYLNAVQFCSWINKPIWHLSQLTN